MEMSRQRWNVEEGMSGEEGRVLREEEYSRVKVRNKVIEEQRVYV